MTIDAAAGLAEPLAVDVDVRDPAWRRALGDPAADAASVLEFAWARVSGPGRPCEVSVVLTDDAEQQDLNKRYRGKDAPTNVLSFPAMDADDPMLPADLPLPLGDIVLALGTLEREAATQGLSLGHHYSHLLVHGLLHLLGYDHETSVEAETMERLETEILAGLGIDDPYGDAPKQGA